MQAAVIPAVNGTWEVKEVPTPEPGANQVLIKIQVSELCCTDVHVTKALSQLNLRARWVMSQ